MSAHPSTRTAPSPTAAKLVRWSGLAAIGAGIIFAGIQPIHPPDVVASVTTAIWALVITLKLLMCLLFLIAITGLYARQVEESGWLGLVGFAFLTVSWWLQTGYVFAEAFILPVLAVAAPDFVDSFLGIVNGSPGSFDIGALPAAYGIVGLTYLLGGILFGVATFRAAVFPRPAAALLAVTALLTPAAVLLPHALQRFVAIPMGITFIWLGWTLWSEPGRSATAAGLSPRQGTA